MSYNTDELMKLPVVERYDIALALWESIEEEELLVTVEERIFAEQRYQEHLKNPNNVISWDEARAQIKKEYSI
jgi:putative addiction module component (TIGR02574 family)